MASKATLNIEGLVEENRSGPASERIYNIIRGIFREYEDRDILYDEALDKCLARGFSRNQIEETIEDYEVMNVWLVNSEKTSITLVN